MPRESKKARRERARKILEVLRKHYPGATTALNWSSPLELLVATILSAQCTDERVNLVTPELFKRYPSARDFADADLDELQEQIRSTGFFRNKAKNIRAACRKIVEEFGGKVPRTMDELVSLPGVARKTASVVLGTCFERNEGIAVDTHVTRLAGRLKLTAHPSNQGDRIEKDLMELIPRDDWTDFSHVVILHGRAICTARKPDCENCPVSELCPSAFKL